MSNAKATVIAAVSLAIASTAIAAILAGRGEASRTASPGLWQLYDDTLSKARYIDLTHAMTPGMPVWKGFGPGSSRRRSTRRPAGRTRTRRTGSRRRPTASPPTSSARNSTRPRTGRRSTRASTSCRRPTRCGRWSSSRSCRRCGATRSTRSRSPTSWRSSSKHGRIPAGSVVMVRSDWSRKWTTDPARAKGLAAEPGLPGRQPRRPEVPAPPAPHPLPRPRAARHGQHADARGRALADAPRLHAGRGRGQPRRRARGGLPRRDRLSEAQGRPRRLRALRRHLPGRNGEGGPISGRDAPLPKYAKRLHWNSKLGYRVR